MPPGILCGRLFFRNPDGTQVTVWSPDPGRALITGVPFANGGPRFLFNANAFKIPSLWGMGDGFAPYFHDNSAKTLDNAAAHYARFLPLTPAPAVLSHQDQQDIVAY